MEDNTILAAPEPASGCRSAYDEAGFEPYEPVCGLLAFSGQGTYQLVVAGMRSFYGWRYGNVVLHNEKLPPECGISPELPEFRIRNAGCNGIPGRADSDRPLDRYRTYSGWGSIDKQIR